IKTRIIGGQSARAGQFPFAAAIHVQTNDSKFFCGGALTGNEWVITAGHCVYNAVLFTIQLGSNHLVSDDPDRMIVATSTYILHPDFNPDTIENDIGLIKFRRPVDYNSELILTVKTESYKFLLIVAYLGPVFAWPLNLQDYAKVYALGWGQITDPELSNDLQYVFVSTISNLECQMVYGNQIKDSMVCIAGNYNEGTCTVCGFIILLILLGDNGGPLVATSGKYYTLVGIASFISANGCESTDPSGYTRTFPYFDWISNMTKGETLY
ncbi:Trypsin domain containing protein, partial [Asbolus verrucosus]